MIFDFNKINKVHFVGIGGIGMSAIARMMVAEGKRVSGSDSSSSKITKDLEELGVSFFEGHNKINILDGVEVVIYTAAITDENPELQEAIKRKIPILSYSEALGSVSRKKRTIAVAGTHGKTTTTAMIAKILKDAGFDPMVVVGSLILEEKSNFISGKGEYFVAEACEYKKSFLSLKPEVIVITNIEPDHLSFYKKFSKVQEAFVEFVGLLDSNGSLVLNREDASSDLLVEKSKARVVDYKSIQEEGIILNLPGRHNIENAKAALALAEVLGIKRKKALESLSNFRGTWRRFEFKGETENGVKVYDDYAHHPTEIRASLKGAREIFPKSRITVIFQPHLFSRTKDFLEEFSKSFKLADKVIFVPIYASREKDDLGMSSLILTEKTKRFHKSAEYREGLEEAAKYIKSNSSKGDVIIIMGAGDVFKVTDILVN